MRPHFQDGGFGEWGSKILFTIERRLYLDFEIQYYVFFKVAEEDELPKIMCGECSFKLNLVSDFREKAYKTETHLLSKVDVVKVKAEVSYIDSHEFPF
jgi:hypothetical protein